MNRDLALSALAAAAIHGGLFFGYTPAAAMRAVKTEPPVPTIDIVPPPPADDPDPVIDNSDTQEKAPVADVVPRSADLPTIATEVDFKMRYVPTPDIDAPNVRQIPTTIGNPSDSVKRVAIFRPDQLDHAPRTRSQIAPVYPFEAKRVGMTGTVNVEFTVDENGRVSDPRIVSSTDRMFEQATIAAVLKWRFEPGTRQAQRVRFRMIAPVVFNLND